MLDKDDSSGIRNGSTGNIIGKNYKSAERAGCQRSAPPTSPSPAFYSGVIRNSSFPKKLKTNLILEWACHRIFKACSHSCMCKNRNEIKIEHNSKAIMYKWLHDCVIYSSLSREEITINYITKINLLWFSRLVLRAEGFTFIGSSPIILMMFKLENSVIFIWES